MDVDQERVLDRSRRCLDRDKYLRTAVTATSPQSAWLRMRRRDVDFVCRRLNLRAIHGKVDAVTCRGGHSLYAKLWDSLACSQLTVDASSADSHMVQAPGFVSESVSSCDMSSVIKFPKRDSKSRLIWLQYVVDHRANF